MPQIKEKTLSLGSGANHLSACSICPRCGHNVHEIAGTYTKGGAQRGGTISLLDEDLCFALAMG